MATINGAKYRSIVEELGNHLVQELEHAKILATQIDFLGGTPTVQVPPVRDCPDGTAALQETWNWKRSNCSGTGTWWPKREH